MTRRTTRLPPSLSFTAARVTSPFNVVPRRTPQSKEARVDQASGAIEAGRVLFRAPEATAQEVLRSAVQRGPVKGFTPQLPTLSEIFKGMTAQPTMAEGNTR